MLPVAGRPFVDWQLRWLAAQGATNVVLSVGHCGDQIQRYVGDGRRWHVDVRYVWERGELLGTAGAIRHAADTGLLSEEFFVLYGDSYLQVALGAVERAFRESNCAALMTVFRNENRWDRSNVIFRDRRVDLYEKNTQAECVAMKYIDYGLLVITRELILMEARAGRPADLGPILTKWSKMGILAGYEARKRFFEGGSPEGLAELESFLNSTVA